MTDYLESVAAMLCRYNRSKGVIHVLVFTEDGEALLIPQSRVDVGIKMSEVVLLENDTEFQEVLCYDKN